MKNWIAILAILLVALAPIAIADNHEAGSESGEAAEDMESADDGDSADSGDSTDRESDKMGERREQAKERMEQAKAQVQERREMAGQKRADLLALRDEVKAACETDKQSDACKQARIHVRDAKHSVLGRIADKMGPTFKRAEILVQRLERVVAHLEKKGKDTSGLNTAAIDAKIAEAQANFDEGKSLFQQARTADPGQKDELMKQAAQKFRAANASLKEARQLIRDWLKTLRQVDTGAIEETATESTSEAPAEESTSEATEETSSAETTSEAPAEESTSETTEETTDDSAESTETTDTADESSDTEAGTA